MTETATEVAKPKRTRKKAEPAMNYKRIAARLKTIADPNRLKIIHLLHEHGSLHVGAIQEMSGVSQANCSHHLALLRHAGIVESDRQGKNNFYSLTDAKIMDSVATFAAE